MGFVAFYCDKRKRADFLCSFVQITAILSLLGFLFLDFVDFSQQKGYELRIFDKYNFQHRRLL